ncbi:MAG: hypothetical protein PHX08_18845 [Lachnospiraceae bacterium]|nr:hypothetical protein [Lachnospiraceae bacterium]
MDTKKKILWITQTAVFTALLIVTQTITSSMSTLVTGSIVNLILILSVMMYGLPTALTVAAISPLIARFLGIGPLWSLIPFIAAGNLALVFLWHIIGNRKIINVHITCIIATIVGALGKFIVLYFGIVKFAIPLLLNLPAKQATAISTVFSVPQLITATIGGILATLIIPAIKNAFKER